MFEHCACNQQAVPFLPPPHTNLFTRPPPTKRSSSRAINRGGGSAGSADSLGAGGESFTVGAGGGWAQVKKGGRCGGESAECVKEARAPRGAQAVGRTRGLCSASGSGRAGRAAP